MNSGISKHLLKKRNRIQILRVVRDYAPISRVDISEMLGLTRAAVTILVNEMIDHGILREVGEAVVPEDAKTQKGRRKILLRINETFKFAAGVYLDETGISIGLTTLYLNVMEKQWIPYDTPPTIDEVVSIVEHAFHAMLQNSCLTQDQLLGMGVGIMPTVFAQMGCQMTDDGTHTFPELTQKLSACLGVPVYVEHAVWRFAQAGLYDKCHSIHPIRQLFLCQDEQAHYIAVQTYKSDCIIRPIDALCIAPNGRELAGYPDGSIQAELSDIAVRERVAPLFSQQQTPALWEALGGTLERATLASLLTASQTDTVLMPLARELMEKLTVLLHNLYTLCCPETICLFRMQFTPENLAQIKEAAIEHVGVALADALAVSTLLPQHYFLCGCVGVIHHEFFETGGFAS